MLLLPVAIPVTLVFVTREIRKNENSVKDYFLNDRLFSYKKTSKIEKIEKFMVLVVFTVFLFFASVVVMSGIAVVMSFIWNDYKEYIESIYQSVNVDLMSWVGLMITVAAILVTYKKEYYLTFSIEDVLRRFQFKERLLNIILAMLGSGVIVALRNIVLTMQQLVEKEEYKYFLIVISAALMLAYLLWLAYSILIGVYLIYRVLFILFSKEQSELEILNDLHYKLNSRDFLVNGNLWEGRKGIAINGEYLLDQYSASYNKIKDMGIYDIQFKTVFDGDKFINRKAENEIVKRYAVLIIVSYLMAGITEISESIFEGIDYPKLLCFLIVYIGLWILVATIVKWEGLNKCSFVRDLKQLLYKNVYGRRVFTYKIKITKKEYIAVLGNKKDVGNFITNIINLMVYLKILISNKKQSEDEEIINKYIKDIQKYTEELKDKQEKRNKNKEKLGEKKKEDSIFYVVNICYEFFRYVNIEEEKQKKILEENKDKEWIKIIKKSRDKEWKRIESMIIAVLKQSQNLFERDVMQDWNDFKEAVLK